MCIRDRNGTTKTSVVDELELLDSLIFGESATEANEFTIAEDGITGNYVINNEVSNADIVLKANLAGTGTEVARVVGSTGSLKMTGAQQLEFDVATNFINTTGGTQLNIKSDGTLAIDANALSVSNGVDDLE